MNRETRPKTMTERGIWRQLDGGGSATNGAFQLCRPSPYASAHRLVEGAGLTFLCWIDLDQGAGEPRDRTCEIAIGKSWAASEQKRKGNAMDDAQRLRELASWYREFAERAGSPWIWEARLATAAELEKEADHLKKNSAQIGRVENIISLD